VLSFAENVCFPNFRLSTKQVHSNVEMAAMYIPMNAIRHEEACLRTRLVLGHNATKAYKINARQFHSRSLSKLQLTRTPRL
jgi:hypothetical protein